MEIYKVMRNYIYLYGVSNSCMVCQTSYLLVVLLLLQSADPKTVINLEATSLIPAQRVSFCCLEMAFL